jgi:predicted dehydrogenase
MRFLIVGLGSIGRRHLRNLLELGERDVVLLRTFRSTLPDDDLIVFPTETKLDDALAHHPDAVIIANPTSLHLSIAIPAALAGCHLFLEKPISHSMQGVDELQRAVQQGGGQVLTAFQFRFHPGLRTAVRLLAEGAIGRPLSVHAHWGEYLPGWHPWEDYRRSYSARSDLGGGVIFTLCHPLDYLRWMLGDVESLWAFAAHLGDLELDVEDTAEIGLRFKNGVLGSVHLDYNQRPESAHWLELIGTRGTLRWDNQDGSVELRHIGQAVSLPASHRDIASEAILRYEPPAGFERNDLFLDEMRHFVQVARGEAQPVCTLQDGLRTLELALAAHRSAEQAEVIRW